MTFEEFVADYIANVEGSIDGGIYVAYQDWFCKPKAGLPFYPGGEQGDPPYDGTQWNGDLQVWEDTVTDSSYEGTNYVFWETHGGDSKSTITTKSAVLNEKQYAVDYVKEYKYIRQFNGEPETEVIIESSSAGVVGDLNSRIPIKKRSHYLIR